EWLIKLVGQPRWEPPQQWWQKLVGSVLTDFGTAFGQVLEPAHLTQSEALLRQLGPLPIVCEQRDFAPWNVHRTPNGKLVVFDWESAVPEGLPLMDLWYFLSFVAFALDGARSSEEEVTAYVRMLDTAT